MSSSSPENYSLEEMMERLKKPSPSQHPTEGELVVRPDGSQAVRVRKRKRRTQQPKREEEKRMQRFRAIQIGTALVGLILLTLVIGGAYLYTNTAPFRDKIADAIAAELGAKVQMREFRVTPLSANAAALTLQWPEGGFPREAELRNIKAKVSPSTIFGRSFTGDEVTANEGRFILQVPSAGNPAAVRPDNGSASVHFARVAVKKLELAFMNRSSQVLRITGTEGALASPPGRGWQSLDLHRGTFSSQSFPSLALERGRVDIHPGEIRNLEMVMQDSVMPKGTLVLSGNINVQALDTRSTLAVKLTAFNLKDLFGAELARFLQVRLDTSRVPDSNYYSFTLSNPQDAEIAVAFTNSARDPRRTDADASIHSARDSKPINNFLIGFPFLDFLAKAAEDPFYKHPAFEQITGVIVSKNGATAVSDLECIRRGRLVLKGDFTIGKNKALSGTLQIGLPESVLDFVNDSRFKAMFGELVRDYRWATVTLSGTSELPTDDFAKAYRETNPISTPDAPGTDAGAKPEDSATPDKSGNPVDPGKAFEDLTQPSR